MIASHTKVCVQFGLFVLAVTCCCLILGTKAEAQKSPTQKSNDLKAELKALRKERQAALAKLVNMAERQYASGRLDFGRFAQAQRELVKATIELEERPEIRIAELEKAHELAKQVEKIAKGRFDAGARDSEMEHPHATAVLLETRIELLLEKLKSQTRE